MGAASLLRRLALPLAGALLATAGFLIASESVPLQLGLLACAAVEVALLWRAGSRAGFAALIAGGFFWAVKRQTGTRRWLMALGAGLFAAGILRNTGLHRWRVLLKLWLAQPALAGELAVLAAATAAIGAWFLGPSPTLAAEGPALAALGILTGSVFSPGVRLTDAAAAGAAIALALWLSRRAVRAAP